MGRIDESVALAAMYAANHLEGVTAIICLTETGATPLLMSRIKSGLPIFAMARQVSTQHKVVMYRGVQSIPFDSEQFPNEEVNLRAVNELLERKEVKPGDLVVLTKGDYVNAQGGTNTMKILRVRSEIN